MKREQETQAGELEMKTIIVIAVSATLAGCSGIAPVSSGGECRVFTDPGFAVQGKRAIDRQWIGATQEKGIEVCGWKRPQQ